MCGRFTLSAGKEKLIRTYLAEMNSELGNHLKPRYNITPGSGILAVIDDWENGGRRFEILHWGLVPSWAKDPNIGIQLTNARIETVTEKPSYKDAFRYRRCLIPADGFYEWDRSGESKQAYYFYHDNQRPMAFAGIWEHWGSADGSEIFSVSILTRSANHYMKDIHHRMPLILNVSLWDEWLHTGLKEPRGLLGKAVRDQDLQSLTHHPVSDAVNYARNDFVELTQKVGIHQSRQMGLFDEE